MATVPELRVLDVLMGQVSCLCSLFAVLLASLSQSHQVSGAGNGADVGISIGAEFFCVLRSHLSITVTDSIDSYHCVYAFHPLRTKCILS